jgi:hypothetical protein
MTGSVGILARLDRSVFVIVRACSSRLVSTLVSALAGVLNGFETCLKEAVDGVSACHGMNSRETPR